MRRVPFAVYNLAPAGDPNRGPAQVELELNALANNHRPDGRRRRPKVIALMETVHRTLPNLRHYQPPIRSTVNLSRANLALYVLDGLAVEHVRWVQHKETWNRVKHPGRHEPRATLVALVEDWRISVGHAPQVSPGNTDRARGEWVDVMADLMDTKRPVLALTDPNGLGDNLRDRVPGCVLAGTPVEAVNGRHITIVDARTPEVVNGVRLLSDHKRALLGRAVGR
jgi:hypothetical protein